MITIVGVGHVFDIAAKIRAIVEELQPNIVGVELDKARYEALRADDRRSGGSITYALLARFQERIAKKYNSKVGQEMLAAVDAAHAIGADSAFIDIDAGTEFSTFMKSMTWKERLKFVFGAFAGLFVSKKRVEKELKHFEENASEYLEVFADQFPTVKKALIDDRDRYMTTQIMKLRQRYLGVVGVIGDGHVAGVQKLIEAHLPTEPLLVIRLSTLRARSADELVAKLRGLPAPYGTGPSDMSDEATAAARGEAARKQRVPAHSAQEWSEIDMEVRGGRNAADNDSDSNSNSNSNGGTAATHRVGFSYTYYAPAVNESKPKPTTSTSTPTSASTSSSSKGRRKRRRHARDG